MALVTVSAEGHIMIPPEIVKAIGLEPGQEARVDLKGNEITIKPLPKDPVLALVGLCKGGPSLIGALLRERENERRLEGQGRA